MVSSGECLRLRGPSWVILGGNLGTICHSSPNIPEKHYFWYRILWGSGSSESCIHFDLGLGPRHCCEVKLEIEDTIKPNLPIESVNNFWFTENMIAEVETALEKLRSQQAVAAE